MNRPLRWTLQSVHVLAMAVAIGAGCLAWGQRGLAAPQTKAGEPQTSAAKPGEAGPVPVGAAKQAPAASKAALNNSASATKAPAAPSPSDVKPAPAPPTVPGPQPGPFRPLAPGAMRPVDPMRQIDETVSRHDVVELLAVNPNLEWAKRVPFRREIWALDFKFKPVRIIEVDLPQPSGLMQRKPIWYLVYSVTNSGKTMRPAPAADGTFTIEHVDKPVHFVPSFVLHNLDNGKRYPDRVIPAAVGPIRMREDPNRSLFNSVEMVRDIQVGETVWGVATWEDIDPATNRFAILIAGLTNAYRWSDEPGKYKPSAPLGTGRHLLRKTLKLNFWRPGDEFQTKETQIRFGIPGELDYEWIYH